MEARVCWALYLFLLSHRAHAVAENSATEGPHTYFSVIRLLLLLVLPICLAADLSALLALSGSASCQAVNCRQPSFSGCRPTDLERPAGGCDVC